MHIGIDASALLLGGGITHLVEMLSAADPDKHGISRVTVWGAKVTLDRVPVRPWLDLRYEPMLEKGIVKRLFWQRVKSKKLALDAGCDVLFIPSGTYLGGFRPYVTMSHNLLPFEPGELRRYGLSRTRMRYWLLHRSQSATFRRADGLILLSAYARNVVDSKVRSIKSKVVIPHGIGPRFHCAPRNQHDLDNYSMEHPFTWLYVSSVDAYKHQWNVVEAVANLRRDGLPVALDIVGPPLSVGMRRKLEAAIQTHDPEQHFIRYRGEVPYQTLHKLYHEADAFVFASTCENLPISLLEAMSAGLPIASSDRGPMPEVLQDAGAYFDPCDVGDIGTALSLMMQDPVRRMNYARSAHRLSEAFNWGMSASSTFAYLAKIAGKSKDGRQGDMVSDHTRAPSHRKATVVSAAE